MCKKIGGGARPGTVFKSRRPTGEVVRPNSPGRDPIISRIIWLEGLDRFNHNTKERLIYIHGTPEERTIGYPTSYGCVRMRSRDVIDLYDRIRVGTRVYIKRATDISGAPNKSKIYHIGVTIHEPTPQFVWITVIVPSFWSNLYLSIA